MGNIDICTDCIEDLPRIHHACLGCALPLQSDIVKLCGTCQRNPPPFDSVHAVFQYDFPVNKLISRLKFRGKLTHARLLGQLMAQSLAAAVLQPPDGIIPVPLHAQRISQRGFNQAAELARYLSQALAIPLEINAVARVRQTAPQTGLSERVRRKNVRGAFQVRADMSDRHVAIVDDVVTTGSTVSELALSLRRSGAARVDVWALARTR